MESDNHPLPRIREIIATLCGFKYFSLIDLKDWVFHISIKQEDREKTTFLVWASFIQFRMMSQGFKNSPSIFRAIELILKVLIGSICLVY